MRDYISSQQKPVRIMLMPKISMMMSHIIDVVVIIMQKWISQICSVAEPGKLIVIIVVISFPSLRVIAQHDFFQ